MNLYAVFADYRKNNEHRYPYYVRANSIREVVRLEQNFKTKYLGLRY